eukprot:m.97147 g.97147  ORF g.97147 m.97147 type:complete len:51 (-) comp13582_c0_seq5:1189-1341(-)
MIIDTKINWLQIENQTFSVFGGRNNCVLRLIATEVKNLISVSCEPPLLTC